MKQMNEIDMTNKEEVLQELNERKEFFPTLVGNLYRGIMWDEICELNAKYAELCKKE